MRSTRKRRLLTFGHVWVVLAVLVPVPFSGRVWALPILFRLFRTEADCQKRGGQHLKKTQLARQLIELVKRWFPDKCVELVADTAYSCREVLRHLPEGVVFVGAMRGDSTLQRPRSRKLSGDRKIDPLGDSNSDPHPTCGEAPGLTQSAHRPATRTLSRGA